MDEALGGSRIGHHSRSVVVATRLEPKQETPKVPAIHWPKWDLTRPQKGLPVQSISRLETELHRSYSSWRGEPTLCFIREDTVGYTAFLLPPLRLLSTDRPCQRSPTLPIHPNQGKRNRNEWESEFSHPVRQSIVSNHDECRMYLTYYGHLFKLVVFAINHDHPKTPCWLGSVDEDCKGRARMLEGHGNNDNSSGQEKIENTHLWQYPSHQRKC